MSVIVQTVLGMGMVALILLLTNYLSPATNYLAGVYSIQFSGNNDPNSQLCENYAYYDSSSSTFTSSSCGQQCVQGFPYTLTTTSDATAGVNHSFITPSDVQVAASSFDRIIYYYLNTFPPSSSSSSSSTSGSGNNGNNSSNNNTTNTTTSWAQIWPPLECQDGHNLEQWDFVFLYPPPLAYPSGNPPPPLGIVGSTLASRVNTVMGIVTWRTTCPPCSATSWPAEFVTLELGVTVNVSNPCNQLSSVSVSFQGLCTSNVVPNSAIWIGG